MLVVMLRLVKLLAITIVVVDRNHARMIVGLKFALVELINLASTSSTHTTSLQVLDHRLVVVQVLIDLIQILVVAGLCGGVAASLGDSSPRCDQVAL